MINRGTFDRLEDAVDRFEETWSPDSHSKIEELLREFRLSDDDEAIVELIRIDIELRYERGLSIELARAAGTCRGNRVRRLSFAIGQWAFGIADALERTAGCQTRTLVSGTGARDFRAAEAAADRGHQGRDDCQCGVGI